MSEVLRSSMGRKATLSRSSAPPTCISVVTSGVWHRTMGRPAGFADAAALPGSLSRTKRFIRAMRAAGVMREKASRFRTVRKRAKSVWLWEQAADNTSRRAAAGAAAAVGVLVAGTLAWEFDSRPRPAVAAVSTEQSRKRIGRDILLGCEFTSILCHAQDGRQILRKRRPRHDFVATGGLGPGGKLGLHVRQEAHNADVLPEVAQLLDGLDRLAARVQVHNDESWLASQQLHQRIAVRGHLQFHAELLGGLRQLHLEKQIIHKRRHSSYWS